MLLLKVAHLQKSLMRAGRKTASTGPELHPCLFPTADAQASTELAPNLSSICAMGVTEATSEGCEK